MKENILGDMMTALADAFEKERQQTEPYKELFKAGSPHIGFLKHLEMQMTEHVFDARDVYQERYRIEINDDQYNFLLALPFLARISEQNLEKREGMICCTDKTYYILSEQFKKLGDN